MDGNKLCTHCQTLKDFSAFGRDKNRKHGLAIYCKPCTNEIAGVNHRGNPLTLKRFRARNKDETYKALQRSIKATAKYKADKAERNRLYRLRFPERVRAHDMVRRALKKGEIAKQPCEYCGDLKVEGHHFDYTKPLEVQWLCHEHHMLVHSAYG